MKVKHESEVTQSGPTLRVPMDCSLPGSSIHGIFQAKVLEWVASAFYCFSLFALITEEGFLLSPCYSLEIHSDGYIFPFLLCLQLLSSAICKASSDNHFAFLHFFFLGLALITASCTMS